MIELKFESYTMETIEKVAFGYKNSMSIITPSVAPLKYVVKSVLSLVKFLLNFSDAFYLICLRQCEDIMIGLKMIKIVHFGLNPSFQKFWLLASNCVISFH